MIKIREMRLTEADKIKHIDRSERIEAIYRMEAGQLIEERAGHECPNWNDKQTQELITRFTTELNRGGTAYGAFVQERLVGFGVLAGQFRGRNQDRLQVDLMYVTREYRRQGIGTQIMEKLSDEALKRGARYLYISSTETESAVQFYRSNGSELTEDKDTELYEMEPYDIHMIKKLRDG
ncbi:GNAT family N-acetyltransferase [Paenibacillus tarimensis]